MVLADGVEVTPRELLYWLRGFVERAGIAGWGDACADAVRKHAAVCLAAHPGDVTAITAQALATHPAALSDWLAAQMVEVTAVEPKPGEDLTETIKRAIDEAKAARRHHPSLGPAVYC